MYEDEDETRERTADEQPADRQTWPDHVVTLADILFGDADRPSHPITACDRVEADGGYETDAYEPETEPPTVTDEEPVDSKVDEPNILIVSTPSHEGGDEAVTEIGVEREIVTAEYVSETAETSRHDTYPVYSGIFDSAPDDGAGDLPKAITEGAYLQATGRIDGDDFACAPVTPIECAYHDCVMWRGEVYRGYAVRFAPLTDDGVWTDEALDYDDDFDDFAGCDV